MTVEETKLSDARVRGRVSVIYVDKERKLLEMDRSVKAELENIDQICFSNNKLSLKDSITNNRLQRLISDVLAVDQTTVNQVGGYIKVATQGSDSILVSVFPFQRASNDNSSVSTFGWAEIRITSPREANLDVFSRAMRDIYELSASESKVVSLLVQGRSTKEIASSLHVADSTLRTHLKRIFSKTETRHQAELVSKILLRDTYVMPNLFS